MRYKVFSGYSPSDIDGIEHRTVKYVLNKLHQGLEKFRLENEEQINGKWYIESNLLIGEITTGLLVDIGREFGIKPFWEE